ncbi:MAG TPA: hypothetical protein ENK04_13545 [Gammaproteobacteria bacterium]|nr:hypothetical protein [Gammaproteobacteria bacterium]
MPELFLSAPLYLAPGDYYFGVIVDPDNAFAETNEDNNLAISSTVLTILDNKDLVVSALSTSTNVVGLQGTFQVNFTVTNQGPVDLAGHTRLSYQIVLSDGAVITSGDTVLHSRRLYSSSSPLAANSSRSFSPVLTLPTGVAEGNYYIGVIVDYTNQYAEADESNNSRSSALTIQ